jgi:hypothetical protein
MIMKTMFSALIALAVLAGIAVAPASADPNPWNPKNDPSNSQY